MDKRIWSAEARLEVYNKRRKQVVVELEENRQVAGALGEAEAFINKLVDEERDALRAQFEGVLNYGLQHVFGTGIRAKFEQSIKRNKVHTELALEFQQDQSWVRVGKIRDAEGGGLADVVSFLLRVCVFCMFKPEGGLLVLDEPFKHLSDAYVPAVMELVLDLIDSFNIQVLMITHHPLCQDYAKIVYGVAKGQATQLIRRE